MSENTPENQVKALLNHRAFAYTVRILGVDNMQNHDYSEVFTITRSEINAIIRQAGLLSRVLSEKGVVNNSEGMQFQKIEGNWYLYHKERGLCDEPQVFNNDDEAHNAVITMLLNSTGTGIDFSF